MARTLRIAAAQIGRIDRSASRPETLQRHLSLLLEAASKSIQLVVFPEVALTTFFPRYLLSPSELATFFSSAETLRSSPDTAPLFTLAHEIGIDIVLGFAETDPAGKSWNTSVYYSASRDELISKYRKVHLPGTVEPFDDPAAINQLEKRYFTPGDLGFQAFRAPGLIADAAKRGSGATGTAVGKGDPIFGMLICNDRRWPEAWRVLTLQGAEVLLFGYNTGAAMSHLWGTRAGMSVEEQKAEALFHSRLVQQANSYMNACFSVSAARCGMDDGKYELIAGSCIVSPEGHVIAEAKTEGDELVFAEIDLELCRQGKEKTFDYARHRRIEHYGLIASQTGVVEPELLD